MPIIIDNFHVRIDAPIDNRFVVGGTDSFYSNRDAIQHKYQGLRIWDLTPNNSGPYYWTGVTWSSENAVGVAVDGTTSPGYLPVFTQGPTVLGKSIIFQNITTTQIGIGLVGTAIQANVPSGPSLVNGLHVDGNIKTNNYFVGSGLHVTDINATNINSGLLNIARISHLSNTGNNLTSGNYVLTNQPQNSSVNWSLASGLSVLNSTNTTNIGITEDLISTNSYITFVNAAGINTLPLRINSSKMQFRPDNGQLLLSDGSASAPVYSFLSNASNGVGKIGMYYNGDISFAFPSGRCFSIRPGTITIYDSNYTQIDFYKSPTDVQKLFVGQGSILKYRTNAWDPNGGIQVASDNIVWHSGNLYTLRDSGNLSLETGRSVNSISTDANGNQLQGVYTYNVYNTAIAPSSQIHWSVLSFGRGVNGSVQLASNWFSGINTTTPGTVYAERDILLRSLRDTGESWSPWVKIWNSGNSGYVPFGAIMMWSGSATLLPTGWRLCDGNNGVTIPILAGSVPGQPLMTSITIPDLRERFVVGAGTGDNPEVLTYIYDRTGTNYGDFTFMYYGSPVLDYTEKVNTEDIGDVYNEYYPNTTGQVTGAYFMYNTGGNYFYYIDYDGTIRKGNAVDVGTKYSSGTTTLNTPNPTQPASWSGDKYFSRIEVYSQAYGFYHVYTKKFETDATTPQVTSTKSGYWYWIFDKRTQNYVLVRGTFNGDASIGTIAGANAVTSTTTPIIYKTGMAIGFSYTLFQKYTNAGLPTIDVNNAQPTKNNARRIQMQGVVWPTSSYNVGDKGGFNDIQLTSATMPQHVHIADRWSGGWAAGGSSGIGQGTGYRNNTRLTTVSGGDQTHENRPPYYALAFIIYTGI